MNQENDNSITAIQPVQPIEEGFITKEIVAQRLSVTPETVRRWASAGRLPSHHFGRRLRFKWSEVTRALANTQ